MAIFDVCWTLYRSNTTIDFITYVLRRDNKLKYIWFVALIWRPIALFLVRVFKIDLRRFAIGQLSGYSKEHLQEHANSFYNSFLRGKENQVVYERFLELKKEGAKIFLASASLDVVIEAIAKNTTVKFVSSQLQYANGVCSGTLHDDLTGKKYSALQKETLINFFDVMYSDNAEDMSMAEYVGNYFQVVNSRLLKKTSINKL